MLPLSTHDILNLWETGQNEYPVNKALRMLAIACPEMDINVLANLTIGQRDKLLFELREQTFGSMLNGFSQCPQCLERLAFSLSSADLRNLSGPPTANPVYNFELVEADMKLTFRLPTSMDIAALATDMNIGTARAMLVERCVIEACIEGKIVEARDLPNDMIKRIAERMAECEQAADILLNIDCPSCDARWLQLFDIVSFFWAEVAARAKRLLSEVHTLARVYGWREADILSMTAARRQSYLEMGG